MKRLIFLILFFPVFIVPKNIIKSETIPAEFKYFYSKTDTLNINPVSKIKNQKIPDKIKKTNKKKRKKYSPEKKVKTPKTRKSFSRNKAEDLKNTKKIFSGKNLNEKLDKLMKFAKKHIGIRYKWAGNNPQTGFDCSGFVKYIFNNFGYNVPRSSRAFYNFGKKISKKNCRKGDIIIFGGRKRKIGHVGIIISNDNGKIKFIHSATSNSKGIIISGLNERYYKKRFVGIRRIIN